MSVKNVIFLFLFIASGCAVSKKKFSIVEGTPELRGTSLSKLVIASNITARDFDIVKAEIELFDNGSGRKLLGSLKYRAPGEYLISLRHRSGLEAARIFITADTVMVNDRISRNLYIGSSEYILNKFGIGTTLIPLIFGDYLISMKDAETVRDCRSGISEIQGYIGDREIWYFLDCKIGKVSSVTVSDRIGRDAVRLNFSEYRKSGNYFYPGKITLEDVGGMSRINIVIGSLEFRDSKKLEFIPGKNYEKIILK